MDTLSLWLLAALVALVVAGFCGFTSVRKFIGSAGRAVGKVALVVLTTVLDFFGSFTF